MSRVDHVNVVLEKAYTPYCPVTKAMELSADMATPEYATSPGAV